MPPAEAPAPAPTPETSVNNQQGPFVVGMGASAGGLEAFKKFLGAMPDHSGVALVLVPHLDPTHESMMVEILGKHTAMKVVEATTAPRMKCLREISRDGLLPGFPEAVVCILFRRTTDDRASIQR